MTLLTGESSVAVRWWREWREWRVLPYHGDMLDQPAYVVEAIGIFEDIWNGETAAEGRRIREQLRELSNGQNG